MSQTFRTHLLAAFAATIGELEALLVSDRATFRAAAVAIASPARLQELLGGHGKFAVRVRRCARLSATRQETDDLVAQNLALVQLADAIDVLRYAERALAGASIEVSAANAVEVLEQFRDVADLTASERPDSPGRKAIRAVVDRAAAA